MRFWHRKCNSIALDAAGVLRETTGGICRMYVSEYVRFFLCNPSIIVILLQTNKNMSCNGKRNNPHSRISNSNMISKSSNVAAQPAAMMNPYMPATSPPSSVAMGSSSQSATGHSLAMGSASNSGIGAINISGNGNPNFSDQLSKTNLYIRGLNPNTTDKDLFTLCSP